MIKKSIFVILLLLPSIIFASTKDILTLQENDYYFGKKNAPIVMITYTALACPHCTKFHTEVLPVIQKKFANDVLFIHRDFPTDVYSLNASVLINCLDKERARDIRFILLTKQEKWVGGRTKEKALANLYNVLKFTGIDREDFNTCMHDQAKYNRMEEEAEEVRKEIGIEGTPTYFINGKKYSGLMTIEEFTKILNHFKQSINQEQN